MRKLSAAVCALFLCSAMAGAVDPKALEVHLRKALNLDTRTPIKVGDPIPSDFEGFTKIPITIADGTYPIYMSKDEKKYLWGNVIDYTKDPDKVRADSINVSKSHIRGSAKAPVTVVEFSDLQCPHCRKAHEELGKIYKTYKESQVRLVYKHFPLSGHDWAEPAAVATECAGNQKSSAFWDMAGDFYTQASSITIDTVNAKSMEFAKKYKLDTAAFDKCRQDPEVLAKVRADKKEGVDAGVNSTPTFFVNGRLRRGIRDFDDIKVLIDEKLAETKKL